MTCHLHKSLSTGQLKRNQQLFHMLLLGDEDTSFLFIDGELCKLLHQCTVMENLMFGKKRVEYLPLFYKIFHLFLLSFHYKVTILVSPTLFVMSVVCFPYL